MNVHEALRSRRTVQRFRPGPVPDGVMERALEAAQLAPNHKLTFPWRFLLPGPVTREALFRAGLRLKRAKKGDSPELEDKVRRSLLDPARAVVVVQRIAEDPHRALEDYAACACATQNLLLSIHADGYGAKWETGGLTRDREALDALGVRADERVVAYVFVGVPEIVPAASPRPDDRVVRLP